MSLLSVTDFSHPLPPPPPKKRKTSLTQPIDYNSDDPCDSMLKFAFDSKYIAVELQWLEPLWNHENMFETGLMSVNHSASLEGIIGIYT